MSAIIAKLKEVSGVYLALTALIGGLVGGILFTVQAVALPARVSAVEEAVLVQKLPERVARLEKDHVGLQYLVCRAAREDRGQDPQDCRLLVKGMDQYLRELAQ